MSEDLKPELPQEAVIEDKRTPEKIFEDSIKFIKLVSGESILAQLIMANLNQGAFLFDNPAKLISQVQVNSLNNGSFEINYALIPYIELSKVNTISLSLASISNISSPTENAIEMYKNFLKGTIENSNDTSKTSNEELVYEDKEHPFFSKSSWVNFVEDQSHNYH